METGHNLNQVAPIKCSIWLYQKLSVTVRTAKPIACC